MIVPPPLGRKHSGCVGGVGKVKFKTWVRLPFLPLLFVYPLSLYILWSTIPGISEHLIVHFLVGKFSNSWIYRTNKVGGVSIISHMKNKSAVVMLFPNTTPDFCFYWHCPKYLYDPRNSGLYEKSLPMTTSSYQYMAGFSNLHGLFIRILLYHSNMYNYNFFPYLPLNLHMCMCTHTHTVKAEKILPASWVKNIKSHVTV